MGSTELVSKNDQGTVGNGDSLNPSISGNGRLVAFDSEADNLIPVDMNQSLDVFVRDVQLGLIMRTSTAPGGLEPNGHSHLANISQAGDQIIFYSFASNLVPNDLGEWDLFVHDLVSGTTSRVGLNSRAEVGNKSDGPGIITDDGKSYIFTSQSTNLVPGDSNGVTDIFFRGGPELTSAGTCPGVMTFIVEGATPGGLVAFIWGTQSSPFIIPTGSPCSSLELDLMPLFSPNPGYLISFVDASGASTISGHVPASACGFLSMQAVELSECTKSNLIDL